MNTKNETPIVERIETELLNIPIERPGVFTKGIDIGDAMLQRLVRLAERQFDATGSGFLHMHIQIEADDHIKHACVLVTRQDREEIVKEFREEFDLLQTFCYGFWYGAFQGPGWDALQPHLRVTWRTKANFDAVQAAREAEKKAG